MKKINIPLSGRRPDWDKISEYKLSHHLWSDSFPVFYNTYVKVCVVCGEGLFVRMYSEEPSPAATYTHRDEPVYNDSCMELFIQPCPGDARYVNFEINPFGTYLSEIGTGRHDRSFLKEITDIQCEIVPIEVEEGWGVQLFVPDELFAGCFGEDFAFSSQTGFKFNIYKCGEKSEYPHYASLFDVGTPTPDYHRPEYFGTANLINERV